MSSLFDSTSRKAGEVAASHSGHRRARILHILTERGPSTIFEVAAVLNCNDHQISGRFGELERDGLIVKTGQRRPKPETQCDAEVYAIAAKVEPEPIAHELEASRDGYGPTLMIDGELFDRGNLLENDLPGIQYIRRPETGGAAMHWRVALILCPGCGSPLKCVEETVAGAKRAVLRCGSPSCNRTWHILRVKEPGQAEVVALVMKHL
jgi:hypothetical protein